MNGLFGLKIQISVGETLLIGVAVSTVGWGRVIGVLHPSQDFITHIKMISVGMVEKTTDLQ